MDGTPTPNLDTFLEAIRSVGDRESVRLRTVDLDGQPRLRTLEIDLRFWPTFELNRAGVGWERVAHHPPQPNSESSGSTPAATP